jgi:hypothetical protein
MSTPFFLQAQRHQHEPCIITPHIIPIHIGGCDMIMGQKDHLLVEMTRPELLPQEGTLQEGLKCAYEAWEEMTDPTCPTF